MRILYVEDNPANLFLIQRIARMGNHEVINYSEGQIALDNFGQDKPDLILMDVQLPGKLTGLDVVKALRTAGHKTPIIAVTAYAMLGDRERCLEMGCDAYIAKPLPVNELVEMIRSFEARVMAAAPKPPPTPVLIPTVAPTPEVKTAAVMAEKPAPVSPSLLTVTPKPETSPLEIKPATPAPEPAKPVVESVSARSEAVNPPKEELNAS